MTSRIRTSFAMIPGWVITRVTDATALRVYAHLAWRYADAERHAFPDEARLATELDIGERTVRRAVRQLNAAGALSITRTRQTGGYYGRNLYTLPLDDPREADGRPNMADGREAKYGQDGRPNMAGPREAIFGRSEVQPDPELQPDLKSNQTKSTSPDVADAPPQDDREQPSLPDTPPVQAAVQDLGTGPECEADQIAVETPSADDLAARPAAAPARLDVKALCDRLADGMVANDCLPPTITQGWRDAARLLIDKDGRELSKALALIDWCQADEFWRGNIKSMGKFREQYDTLRLRALSEWERGKGRGGGHVPFQCPTDDSAYDEPLRVRA